MRRKDIIVVLGLLILVLIFFRKLISFDKLFLGGDLCLFYPLRQFFLNYIKRGDFPFWNPYVFSGSPTASLNSLLGLFNPFNFIFLILPLNFAFNCLMIIHIFLAGFFMYLFMRHKNLSRFAAFISAITFMFGGSFVILLAAGMIDLLAGIVLLPLIFLLFDKALIHNSRSYTYSIWAGITIGLQGLSGHPQISMMTIYALFFYFAYILISRILKRKLSPIEMRRWLFIFIITLLIGIGIYALQIFPFLEGFLNHSLRSFKMDYGFVSGYSLHPKQLLTFFMPNLFGNTITGYYWGEPGFDEICRYLGVLALILALLAILFARNKDTRFYTLLLIISLFMAFGKYSPLHKLCYYLLPGFTIFRCPARWLFLSILSLSILAGFGLSFLIEKTEKKRLGFFIKLLLFFNISIIILLFLDYFMKVGLVTKLTEWVTISSFGKEVDFSYRYSTVKKSLVNFTFLLTTVTLCLSVFWKNKINLFLFKAFILMLTILDLWFFGQKFIIMVDKELYLTSKQWDFFKKDKDFYRIRVEPPINDYSAPANECFVLKGEESGVALRDYDKFRQKVKNFPQILNTKYILTTDVIDTRIAEFIKRENISIFDPYDFKQFKFYKVSANIYRYNNFIHRAFMVHKIIVAKDEDEVFEKLNDTSLNLKEVAILEGEGFFLNMPAELKERNDGSVEIGHYSPNRIKLKADLNQSGLLILNEIFFPGWQVYVNGQREHIFKANYLMRAVYLKEGNHIVEFIYRPISYKLGAGISLLTILILLSLEIKQRYERFINP